MYYKNSRPRHDGKPGTIYAGSDHADTIVEGLAANERRRQPYSFALTATSADRQGRTCAFCKGSLAAPARVSVDYHPDLRKAFVFHSLCGLEAVVSAVVTADDLAGVVIER